MAPCDVGSSLCFLWVFLFLWLIECCQNYRTQITHTRGCRNSCGKRLNPHDLRWITPTLFPDAFYLYNHQVLLWLYWSVRSFKVIRIYNTFTLYDIAIRILQGPICDTLIFSTKPSAVFDVAKITSLNGRAECRNAHYQFIALINTLIPIDEGGNCKDKKWDKKLCLY